MQKILPSLKMWGKLRLQFREQLNTFLHQVQKIGIIKKCTSRKESRNFRKALFFRYCLYCKPYLIKRLFINCYQNLKNGFTYFLKKKGVFWSATLIVNFLFSNISISWARICLQLVFTFFLYYPNNNPFFSFLLLVKSADA